MNTPENPSQFAKFRRLPAPANCSLHAAVLVEEGLNVPTAKVEHYARLWGRSVTEIRFERYNGETLPVIVFSGKVTAAVYCDPECNAPGYLGIDWAI
jgi:hypothetical protein